MAKTRLKARLVYFTPTGRCKGKNFEDVPTAQKYGRGLLRRKGYRVGHIRTYNSKTDRYHFYGV